MRMSIYCLFLSQLIGLLFLIMPKQSFSTLLWKSLLATHTIVALSFCVAGALQSPFQPESILAIPMAFFGSLLIQYFLFHVMAGPIIIGVLLVSGLGGIVAKARIESDQRIDYGTHVWLRIIRNESKRNCRIGFWAGIVVIAFINTLVTYLLMEKR
ncbi:MAG: hypothetical protein U0930_17545 [Pirellulales bacterium]